MKVMKTINIEEKNLHISWTTWEISTKFSGNISLIIIVKVKIKVKFFFEKPLEVILLIPPEFLELKLKFLVIKTKIVLRKYNDGVSTC